MEVKAGYKQTEVGVIPEDWDVRKLGEYATFKTGPFGSTLHKSDYVSDGVPVINPMHIIDGQIVPSKSMTVTDSIAKQLSAFRLQAHDIIIGRRGDMGRCAVVQQSQVGWLCGTGSMIIRSSERFVPDFLQRILSSPRAVSAIEEVSVGSTMININQGVLADLKVPLPPLPEQRTIATALSDVDALITSLDNLIAKKRDIKQAAMQELLTGNKRLPGFTLKWKVKRLGDLSEMFGGGTPPTSVLEYYDGKIPWVSIADMTRRGKYISETDRNLTEKGLENCAAKILPAGTILFAEYASIGECSIAATELCTSQAILGITPKTVLNNLYLYFSLMSKKEEIKQMGQHGTQANLNSDMVKDFEILLPSLSEQTAIATILSDMDADLTALEQKRDKTKAIKQGMMQELLTGRIRLV